MGALSGTVELRGNDEPTVNLAMQLGALGAHASRDSAAAEEQTAPVATGVMQPGAWR